MAVPAGFCEKTATANLGAQEEIRYSLALPSAGPNFTLHTHIHGTAFFVIRQVHPSSASTLPSQLLVSRMNTCLPLSNAEPEKGRNHGLCGIAT